MLCIQHTVITIALINLGFAGTLPRFRQKNGMRCLRPIEIFGVHILTGILLSRARGRQGVPGELICEDVAAA